MTLSVTRRPSPHPLMASPSMFGNNERSTVDPRPTSTPVLWGVVVVFGIGAANDPSAWIPNQPSVTVMDRDRAETPVLKYGMAIPATKESSDPLPKSRPSQ